LMAPSTSPMSRRHVAYDRSSVVMCSCSTSSYTCHVNNP
jgi:hypothetical protein